MDGMISQQVVEELVQMLCALLPLLSLLLFLARSCVDYVFGEPGDLERAGQRVHRELSRAARLFNGGDTDGAFDAAGVRGHRWREADFLHAEPGLDKAVMGRHLGAVPEACDAYVRTLQLSGVPFLSALRRFLRGVRLPGEAQVIDRIVESFAAAYASSNAAAPVGGVALAADTAHVLAFALIMLNSDAHNPAVKVKMTRDQFTHNLRGVDAGSSLPFSFLSKMYDAITPCIPMYPHVSPCIPQV